ncbi:unnamed protein product [marine sediment metagenome]|uniref:Uncharacterized protein n=1 Tax=marine sediment metagenome TaxID=412755 RepID=X1AVJ2_9ZZZZ
MNKEIKKIKYPISKIKDIRGIIYKDEIYLNAKDVCLMMKKESDKYQSISLIHFIRMFILNLIR